MAEELGTQAIEEIDVDVAEVTEEKTFTQADVDKVVTERLAREKKKYGDYYDNKEKLSKLELENTTLKELSEVLAQAQVTGTPAEQVDFLRDYYGITKKQAEKMVNASTNKGVDETTAYINADRFARTADDEAIEIEVERIYDIPPKNRTAEEELKLELLGKRYGNIKFGKEFNNAQLWFKKTYETSDEEFNELINSDEFAEFAQGSKLPLQKEVEKYLKFTKKEVKKKEAPASIGSVKDNGGNIAKDYYSKDEVEKMTPEEVNKNLSIIQKSIPKWK